MAFNKGNRSGVNNPGRIYKCVYCKRAFTSRVELGSHDVMCDSKEVMKRAWGRELSNAKNKERRRGKEGK